jgi:hypothetical protein
MLFWGFHSPLELLPAEGFSSSNLIPAVTTSRCMLNLLLFRGMVCMHAVKIGFLCFGVCDAP